MPFCRFLLKYATRDEVDILDRGTGGILEIRRAIAAYEEPSPLYGFLKYRRRNVVIKYVPEGVSRLVQGRKLHRGWKIRFRRLVRLTCVPHLARVTVHFNAVTDTLSPHDTVFSIETAKQLRDSTLSAACSLHTASGSTSSSTSSLRQRRLLEIEEEEEEENNRRHSTVLEEYAPTIGPPSINGDTVDDSQVDGSVADSSNDSNDTVRDTEALNLAPTISITSVESDTSRPSISTVTERPSFQDPRSELNRYHSVNSYTSYSSSGRQKVKLGPRPSLDAHNPGTSSVGSARPVSSLPAGLKLHSRKSHRPKERLVAQALTASNRSLLIPNMDGSTNRVLQNAIERPLPPSRPTTSDSVRSSVSINTIITPSETITPQKAKLMQALEARKRKMAEREASELAVLTEATAAMEAQAEKEASSSSALTALNTAVSDDIPNSSAPASPLEASITQEKSTRASSVSEAEPEGSIEKLPPTTESDISTQFAASPVASISTVVPLEDAVVVVATAEGVASSGMAVLNKASQDLVVAESSSPELQINGDNAAASNEVLKREGDQPQSEAAAKELVPQSKFSSQKENEKPESASTGTVQSRKSLVAPIITDSKINRQSSETDLANDDALMDELQSATVQEAKPMQLPKSPGKALFPRDIKRNTMATDRFTRATSNPTVGDSYEQRPTSSRSVSASNYLNRISQQQSNAPVGKKVNVGGGIAERIKALEKLRTSNAGAPTLQTPSSAVSASPSPTFFAVRRTIVPGNAPSIAERADSMRRPPSQASTRGTSPEQFKGRGRTLSTTSRNDPYSLSPTGYTGRASIQIARDSSRPALVRTNTNIDYSDYNTHDVSQSRVSMDQQRAIADEVLRSTSPEKSDKHGRQSSITAVKGLITGRRQSVTQDNQSVMSGDSSPEKKQSRASRMLQKMSSTLSSSRKNTVTTLSPPLQEEAEPVSDARPSAAPVTVHEMGDVNVQFPDNLLWKRRAMHLDSVGYLILTQSQGKGSDANASVKKYHLTEFKRPQVPDIDMEEMPNSVVLGFVEGSGLQFACSDRQGQMWCLQSKSHQLINDAGWFTNNGTGLQEAHAQCLATRQ